MKNNLSRSVTTGVLSGMVALALFSIGINAEAATYYLNAKTGSDKNNGRTPKQAWRSLAKVNALKLAPGDQVVLTADGEFTGSLELQAEDAGTPKHPIIIRGAGSTWATIVSPKRTAISLAAGGIEIRNLVLKGKATAEKKDHNGIALLAPGKKGERYPHVRLSNLEIADFGAAAITMGSNDVNLSGYDDVQITRVKAHGNYGVGIISFDKIGDRKKGYAHRKVVLMDCDTSNNHGGSGIILSGIDDALVIYCRSADNAGPGGGVGIWAYAAKDVVFNYCIASGTRTRGKDGGGFDLDGACIDCTIENCLAYDNDGPGYMHCDYPTAGLTSGNRIYTSISINDGRFDEKGNSIGFGFVTWGSGLDNCHITSNLTVITRDNRPGVTGEALFVAYVPDYQGQGDVQHVRSCTATNNTVIVSGKGIALVDNGLPKSTLADVAFVGNTFRVQGEAKPLFIEEKKQYDSLDAWRTATGQEKEPVTAKPPVPEVTAPSYKLKNPRELPNFFLMKWLTKSAKPVTP